MLQTYLHQQLETEESLQQLPWETRLELLRLVGVRFRAKQARELEKQRVISIKEESEDA